MASTVATRDHDYAVSLVQTVCCLAGNPSYLEDLRSDLQAEGIPNAITNHDTPRLFNWLITALSYQGIADHIAKNSSQARQCRWAEIEDALGRSPSCPKLEGYWPFTAAVIRKTSGPVPSPIILRAAPYPAIRCATAG